MMQQYWQFKQQYQDCILLYRLGDFYEMFLDDAETASQILDITLTRRARGKDGDVPMCGVPYHAAENYISKLVLAGQKVAICDQVGEPTAGASLVDRAVTRVITPGTLLYGSSADATTQTIIMTLVWNHDQTSFGAGMLDSASGRIWVTEFDQTSAFGDPQQAFAALLSQFQPTEFVLHPDQSGPEFLHQELTRQPVATFPFTGWSVAAKKASHHLKKHFQVKSLQSYGLENQPLATQAGAVVLQYVSELQFAQIDHVRTLETLRLNDVLQLDRTTITNLELLKTLHQGLVHGSVWGVLNKTKTAMGSRLLQRWLLKPLADKDQIEARHDQVDQFVAARSLRATLRKKLRTIRDLDRILARLHTGIGTPVDLQSLASSLHTCVELDELLQPHRAQLTFNQLLPRADLAEVTKLAETISTALVDNPPADPKKGGIFAKGFDPTLDDLLEVVHGGQNWLKRLEQTEREKTGLSSLKLGYNKVYGYYLEISKTQSQKAPAHYLRKQTLVNAERYITPELKEFEEKALSAQAEAEQRELALFQDLVKQVLRVTNQLQTLSNQVAELDCFTNLAELAQLHRYVRPQMHDGFELEIKQGRHLVLEHLNLDHPFVPNDIELTEETQLLMITGPNMAGKSVLMRQVALIVLLAHMGSFVPAEAAKIGITDRIFVRSGASDMITAGLSTFMVEMVETAAILHQATPRSLIIMDEIGRGTSTYDRISIAWAVAEHLVTNPQSRAKTLFATHYHELQALAAEYPEIKNAHLAVHHHDSELVFLYQLTPGGAEHSFGIAVAELTGLPKSVLTRASELLEKFSP